MELDQLDDDVFFADISKQISLLIMDEDELNPIPLSSSSPSPLSFQGLFRGGYQMGPYMYNNQEQSKGTGVFIPRSSQPRRKNQKQTRFSSFNNKQQHQQQQQHSLHHNKRYYNQQINYENSRTLITRSSNNNDNVHESITRKSYRDATSIST